MLRFFVRFRTTRNQIVICRSPCGVIENDRCFYYCFIFRVMSRRGRGWWRRDAEKNGWGNKGGYMAAKVAKLDEQFEAGAASSNIGSCSAIFRGVAIYVDGYTSPSADELRRLMQQHGGRFHVYLSRSSTTHIIAVNLAHSKFQALLGHKVVHPQWITNSIAAGKLLSYVPYRLQSAYAHSQKTLNFSTAPFLNQASVDTLPSVDCTGQSPVQAEYVLKKSSTSSEKSHRAAWSGNPEFISEFYSHSRLHHIATWRSEFDALIGELRRHCNGVFPGREQLRELVRSRDAKDRHESGEMYSEVYSEPVIMHVDMDCFFVSVALLHRPELRGKPVAVTHARGRGLSHVSPEADPEYESYYYTMKAQGKGLTRIATREDLHGEAGSFSDEDVEKGLDSFALSMAEIASCSYEARQAGVKNGMFFGKAKQICPELQAVPYNFKACKEVALSLYHTLASFTKEIEAVSCDEALVDATEVLNETEALPEELAQQVRAEIMAQTGCAASVGMGPNILLAKIATRKAKPDGFVHLRAMKAMEFLQNEPVTCLPGVGQSMAIRLHALGAETCGQLAALPLDRLRHEFGPRTGRNLHSACRGQDDRALQPEKQRKSVSAEVNYGIRFKQAEDAEAFVRSLSSELAVRLEAAGFRGHRLTLKLMMRKAGAPTESTKFLGHGICDHLSRSIFLLEETSDAATIGSTAWRLLQKLALSITDIRGVGLQMQKLVPIGGKGVMPKRQANASSIIHMLSARVPKSCGYQQNPSTDKSKTVSKDDNSSDGTALGLAHLHNVQQVKPLLPSTSGCAAMWDTKNDAADLFCVNTDVPSKVPAEGVQVQVAHVIDGVHPRRHEAKLAGFSALLDVKNLLRQWVLSSVDPQDEDVMLVISYCSKLIEENLEALHTIMKFLIRVTTRVGGGWDTALSTIVDSVQCTVKEYYGAPLKI
uniref:DNA repair protein REV1 isoform X2 n=1 Tax=Myxine glutinosa TaxID=7769 RepID=UPI00358EE42E